MMVRAVRSRLIDLRRQLEGARQGRELLDQKREALQRELSRRMARWTTLRAAAAEARARARARFADAAGELGRLAVDAAALAQGSPVRVTRAETSLAGVALAVVVVRAQPLRLDYGLGGSSQALDRAATAYADTLIAVLAFAEQDAVVRRLRDGLARTNRRLSALDTLVIPGIQQDLRQVAATLEEDERDEALQRKQWRLRPRG